MAERIIIAQEFIQEGHPQEMVLRLMNIPKSTYYYKPKADSLPKGRPCSVNTKRQDGSIIDNEIVVEQIKEILSGEFVDYGYLKTTHALRQEHGYIISSKKVYRLMSEHKLLNLPTKTKFTKRAWVKELVPKPVVHFSYLEFDIKYIYIKGKRKNGLLITVIDVYSRWVLGQYISWQIRKGDVIKIFDKIFTTYTIPEKIFVRNDNGSQMIAQTVQKYFKDKKVVQEFTKPATPEQNAHIESYHSIIERVICQRYEFDNLVDAGETFTRFVKFYNYERIHSGIGYLSPFKYLLTRGTEIKVDSSMFDALNIIKNKVA